MKCMILTMFILITLDTAAQQEISGTVRDRKGDPVGYANIYIEKSYDGTTSDSAGFFTLQTDLTGRQLLVASLIGFERYAAVIVLNGHDTTLSLILWKKVGEEGMLFVRGGDSHETKTYMDGMLVQSPYFSKMPDVPTRGRFSPLLFSETFFSTGGYSAEFGGSLSSIIDLTTNGLETGDKTSVSLMTVGANASMARKWDNSSLAMTGMYCDNTLHHILFRPKVDWIKDSVLGDGVVIYRKKIGETGLLKSFCSYNYNSMQM